MKIRGEWNKQANELAKKQTKYFRSVKFALIYWFKVLFQK